MPNLRRATRLVLDRRGITAIEYGMIAGLIAAALLVGATIIGNSTKNVFSSLANTTASPSAAPTH